MVCQHLLTIQLHLLLPVQMVLRARKMQTSLQLQYQLPSPRWKIQTKLE